MIWAAPMDRHREIQADFHHFQERRNEAQRHQVKQGGKAHGDHTRTSDDR